MKSRNIFLKCIAIVMIVVLSFQFLSEINSHTYSSGISSFHKNQYDGIICCFGGCGIHLAYSCGKTFHY